MNRVNTNYFPQMAQISTDEAAEFMATNARNL